MGFRILAVSIFCLMPAAALATVPYAPNPDWTSAETTDYGTGCDLGDVNGDGWLDVAVSNGNDIVQAANFVYLNDHGALPDSATWVSDDALYSGHCAWGDVDGDGWPDLAVVNYIGTDWSPGRVQLYRNLGGVLETTPSWTTPDTIHSFRCDFGDPDGDGDLDLAVATGEAYGGVFQHNLVYFNEGGALAAQPGWHSAQVDACYDVQFVDFDVDGDQDLAFLADSGPVRIHLNDGGLLDTTSGWSTATIDNGNTFDFADADADGRPDLVVSNNDQTGGAGRFQAFVTAGGPLPMLPTWESATGGYGSAIVLVDVNLDGFQDIVAGRWWGELQVYLNDRAGDFPGHPDWASAGTSVIEAIRAGDLDNGSAQALERTFDGAAATRLLDLGVRHLQGVDEVEVDGVVWSRDRWCADREAGWISLETAPVGTATVRYRHSPHPDLVISNWDGATQLYTNPGISGAGAPVAASLAARAWPNPFNPRVVIAYELARDTAVSLDVFDLRGRRVAQLVDAVESAGPQQVTWEPRDLPSGTYLYLLTAGATRTTGKLQLVR